MLFTNRLSDPCKSTVAARRSVIPAMRYAMKNVGDRPKDCAANVVKVSCYYGDGATNCIDKLAIMGGRDNGR